MSEIVMTRVDARLVHGQVAGRWIKILNANKVVIVEDEVANDEFQVEMFKLVAPPGVEIRCLTMEQGIEEWKKDKYGDGRTIILFKYPWTACDAWKGGIEYTNLNVAQVPMAEGRRRVYNTVHLNPTEIDGFLELVDKGVNVYIQDVPEASQMPMSEAVKSS